MYKYITALIAIFGAIGGIYLGFKIPSLQYNSMTEGYNSNFNIGLAISCWISVIILCLIFYGIASILEYLENLGAYQNESIETETPTISLKNAENIDKGDWICPKCGTINKTYVGSCGCGYSKDNSDLWECPECHVLTPYNNDNECINCHWRP